MQVSALSFVILLSVSPGGVSAQDFCPKKTDNYDLVEFSSIVCQFDLIFTGELVSFGLIPSDTIRTVHRGDGVYAGQVAPFGEIISPYAPAGAYRIDYRLSREESVRMDDLIRYAPGYFDRMQARITAAAHSKLCALMPEDARDFMRLGGQISYDISLVPTAHSERTPNRYMTTTIFISHCEAP